MKFVATLFLSVLCLSACAVLQKEPPEAYIVFFEQNSADVPVDASKIVAAAASDAKRNPTHRVEVSGYTGNEADARTNPKLQRERFASVEHALIAQGVDRARISRDALNDEAPLPDVAMRRFEIRIFDPAGPPSS